MTPDEFVELTNILPYIESRSMARDWGMAVITNSDFFLIFDKGKISFWHISKQISFETICQAMPEVYQQSLYHLDKLI